MTAAFRVFFMKRTRESENARDHICTSHEPQAIPAKQSVATSTETMFPDTTVVSDSNRGSPEIPGVYISIESIREFVLKLVIEANQEAMEEIRSLNVQVSRISDNTKVEKVSFEKRTESLPSYDLDAILTVQKGAENHDFLSVPAWLLVCSGLRRSDSVNEEVLLYIRKSCRDHISFILETVIERRLIGYIHGQPGTGKSMTTLVTACFLAAKQGWNVLWLHLAPDGGKSKCIRITTDGVVRTALVAPNQIENVLSDFTAPGNDRCLFIVDGVTLADPVKGLGIDWVNSNSHDRRLIRVSSMGSCQSDPKILYRQGMRQFLQSSWILSEYETAIRNTDFARSVKMAFSEFGETTELTDREYVAQRLDAKFHFAGGSARFMFEYSKAQIVSEIAFALESVKESEVPITATGSLYDKDRNRLYQIVQVTQASGITRLARSFVSQYTEDVVSAGLGPNEIKQLARDFWLRDCPGSVGSLFEKFVFASLWKDRIALVDRHNHDASWTHPSDFTVRLNPSCPDVISCALGEWRRPAQPNFGSIDGIRLIDDGSNNREGTLRMVKMTTQDRHGFNFEFVKLVIDNLENPRPICGIQGPRVFTVNGILITFIVPRCILSHFSIKPSDEDVKGFTAEVRATLSRFGWIGSLDDLISRIEILGATEWDQDAWH